VAVVTGGARGIGRAVAEAVVAAGGRVAVADVDAGAAARTAGELGAAAAGFGADVADVDSVRELRRAVRERLGPVHLLVNNAGVISVAPVLELDPAEWDRVMAVNARGTFLCSQAFGADMAAAGEGAIVNVASIAGRRGDPTLAHYSASKFAVVGFTQALAQELAGRGVTVNAVCPGTVPTEMMRELARRWDDSVEGVAARSQALPRPQEPAEVAAAVLFLASMPSITGQALNVDGGSVLS
jgi:meso-butanediol dehydrogenase/(S,S)-butanediol dehydrogenase/diacetyl reductase